MARGEVKYRITADTTSFESAMGRARHELESFGKAMLSGAGFGAGFEIGEKAAEKLKEALVELPKIVIEATKKLAEHAHEIEILSAKTGLSIKSIQEFGVAFKVTGTSIEQVGALIPKMEKAIVNGSAAFEAMGLSAKKLRQEKPEEAFRIIAERIHEMKNPMEQAAASMAVFGKAGANILPAIKFGLEASADAAHHLGAVMSDETVEAAAELAKEAKLQGIAWDALSNNLASVITDNETLRDIFHEVTEAIAKMSRAVHDHKAEIGGAFAFMVEGAQEFKREVGSVIDALKLMFDMFARMAGLGGAGVLGKMASGIAGAAFPGLKRAGEAMGDRMAYEKALADMRHSMGLDIPMKTGGGGGPGFNPKGHKGSSKANEHDKSWAEYREAIAKMEDLGHDALFKLGAEGKKAIESNVLAKAKDQVEALKDATAAGDEASKAIQHYAEIEEEKAVKAAEDHRAALISLADAFASAGDQMGGFFGTLLGMGGAGIAIFENLKHKATDSTTRIAAAANALQTAMQIMGGPGGARGMLGGAASGAAAGAAFGGIGAVIGGIAGGILGLFGSGDKKRKAEEKKKREEDAKQAADDRRKARTEGVGVAAEGLTNAIGKIAPATQASANAQATIFSLTFWETFKEKGLLGAVDAFRETFGKLTSSGFDVSAILGPITQVMAASANEAFRSAAEGAQGFAQVLQGLSQAQIPISITQLAAFGQTAQDAFAQAQAGAVEAGLSQEEAQRSAFAVIAPLLQQIMEAHRQYGTEIDANTQALIDQAQAAGIAFPTGPLERMVTLLESIARALGAVTDEANRAGGAISGIPAGIAQGEPMPSSPEPVQAARGLGPAIMPNVGRGLGPRIQTHPGEGVVVIPAHLMKSGKVRMMPRAFQALAGVGREREPGGGGGGGGTGGGVILGGGVITGSGEGTLSAGTFGAKFDQLSSSVETLAAAVAASLSKPSVSIQNAPTVNVTGARDAQETAAQVSRALKENSEGLRSQIESISVRAAGRR